MLLTTGPMRDDDVQTMVTVQPIDRLLYPFGPRRTAREWVVALLIFPILHLSWTLRALFNPVFLSIGTAFTLSAADSAMDIVLNSVTQKDQIGFSPPLAVAVGSWPAVN